MAGKPELTITERAALASVGVDPDAKPGSDPGAPPVREIRELPRPWQAVIERAKTGLDGTWLAAFFETPQPDLEDAEGMPMTPAKWLETGGDPSEIVALLRHH